MKKVILLGLILFSALCPSKAQFISAVVNESLYPVSPQVLRPNDAHCYTAQISIGGAPYNLLLWSWNNPSSSGEGFSWRLRSGSTTVSTGTIPMPNTSSIDLGIMQEPATGTPKVIVGYHRTGSGHRVDIYNVSTSTLTLSSSVGLSGNTSLPRIAVDAHKLYGTFITWADNQGIMVRTINTSLTGMLAWGPTYVLNNTVGCQDPDVAFSHAGSNPLNGHIVYYNAGNNRLEEQRVDYFNMQSGGGGVYPGLLEDLYPIPSGFSAGIASIDAPDHGFTENWAYAFAQNFTGTPNGPIIVRVYDPVTGVRQFDATEGPFGMNPASTYNLSKYINGAPSIGYDPNDQDYRVAWYVDANPWSSYGRYVVQEMDPAGNFLNAGAPQYLDAEKMPANNISPWAARCITLNPNNDFSENFTAFGHLSTSGAYAMKTKSFNWTMPTFRLVQSSGTGVASTPDFDLYPNPSTTAPVLSFTGGLGDATDLNASLVNSLGRVVAKAAGDGATVTTQVMSHWEQLAAGHYFLSISSATMSFSKSVSVQKL